MSTQRPANSAILGVSMPLSLKNRIKRLADADKRTMASWAAIQLEKIVTELESSGTSKLSIVADASGNESSRSTPAGTAAMKYPCGKRRTRKTSTLA